MASTALRKGPGRHGGQDYWLSTDSLKRPKAAQIPTEVFGGPIRCDVMSSADLEALLANIQFPMEPKCKTTTVEFMEQVVDGLMGYIGTVRDDVPYVTGRPSTRSRQWATENCETLMRIAIG